MSITDLINPKCRKVASVAVAKLESEKMHIPPDGVISEVLGGVFTDSGVIDPATVVTPATVCMDADFSLGSFATATPATVATEERAKAVTVAQVATVAVATLLPPAAAMTGEAEATIRAWLAHIEETDEGIIAEVLNQCHVDMEAQMYFLGRTGELTQPIPDDDDRRHCGQCANLAPSGLCIAARRGQTGEGHTYHPVDHMPRRCEGYAPDQCDPGDLDAIDGQN